MKFHQTADGKNVFLSIDSRVTRHNPLYKAWKTKSFTDGDITLHFIVMDILPAGQELSLGDIVYQLDKNYRLGISHISWTNIWLFLDMQEYLMLLRLEKNSTNM